MVETLSNLEFKMSEILKSVCFAVIAFVLLIVAFNFFPYANLGASSYFDFIFSFTLLATAVHMIRIIR